jgi:BlaI family transcriptional regulator, penicillinase repressor
MARPKSERPTDLELEILKALWERGPSTVREIREALTATRPMLYTTVLKMLQIMTEKGLVVRDERERAHVYHPKESRKAVAGKLTRDLLSRVFDGSTSQLVLHALEHKRAKPEELAEIRRLIEQVERRGR